jgi:hypothetical protein
MLTAHSSAAPGSAYLGHESAPLITLDSVAPPYLEAAEAPFLKIDTQGYEWHVLDGALATLPKVRGIQMELSLIPLYEGQRLWRKCIERLDAEGFVLWALQPVFVDPAMAQPVSRPEGGHPMQWSKFAQGRFLSSGKHVHLWSKQDQSVVRLKCLPAVLYRGSQSARDRTERFFLQ